MSDNQDSELRWYAIAWFDPRSMPEGQRIRSVAVRMADMKDAITLFDREGVYLSGCTWGPGSTYKVRAITQQEYEAVYGLRSGPVTIEPGKEPWKGA